MIKGKKNEFPSLKENTRGRILCGGRCCDRDYFPQSSTFLCLQKSGGKVPHSHWSDANTFHVTHTYLSDKTWLHTHLPIYPQETSNSFFLCSSSSLVPEFPSFLPSSPLLPLPPSLRRSVEVLTHRRTDPNTHPSLPSPLAISLPLLLPSHTQTCTRSEWQLANFYTTGNTPPILLAPHFSLSLFLSTSLNISPPC